MYDKDNIFSQMIRGDITPSNIVYEDDFVLSFHDIKPQAKIHVLVIPKGEYKSFDDFCHSASTEEVTHFFKVTRKIANTLGLSDAGYRLIANHAIHARQEVPHFHIHILGGNDVGPMTVNS